MEGLSDVPERIAALLKPRGETIAVAESSAGGLISAALLAVPGASAYFLGGTVVYTLKSREMLLGLTKDVVAGRLSSTEPYTQLMANTVRERFGATWGLAETGTAGPTGGTRSNYPPGRTVVALAGPDGLAQAMTLETGSADREANMRAFARAALELLHKNLVVR